MNNSILILGDSGTGKSTSFRTLPPEQTFIINVAGKSFPFRGANKKYIKLSGDGLTGNYYCSDSPAMIKRAIEIVNTKRPEIKYLIIDDLGYVVMNAFMAKAMIKGYEKYNELGKEFHDLVEKFNKLRDDLFLIATMHVETDTHGKTKPKTVGKMIDQYICVEGKFTHVFHTSVSDGNYRFITNNDGVHMAKNPMDLFPKSLIPNDMLMITQEIEKYLNEDVPL